MPSSLGKLLVVTGGIIMLLGLILLLGRGGGLGFLGRLPGDLRFGGKGFTIYVPLATSLLLSVVITLVLQLFLRK